MSQPKDTLSALQPPGAQFVDGRNNTLTFDQHKAAIESAPLPKNVYNPNKAQNLHALPSGVQSFAAGIAGNTVQGPASIVELARALKNDVDLIHEFVHNNIAYLANQGLAKGGLGALADGMANAFDTSDLMVQLLRQAGYTANYLYGELDLSESEANGWLGTTTIWAARNLLLNGGISANVVWNGSENRLQFSHCWVKVSISGTWYQFDPVVLRSFSTKSGINLATAMSYNATTFMNNARSGATVNTDYVQSMNRANVRSDLATMTANLVSWIRTNDHDANMDDILGGRTINPLTPGVRNTSHPKLKSGTTPTEWTAIPDAYKHYLTVLYDSPNINVSFWSADIYTQRLTLFFNGSHQAELRLDGTLIATSSAQGVGTWNSVQLGAGHPYGGTWANQVVWHRVWADKYYLIANAWGFTGREQSEIHRKRMNENKFGGAADSSESVLGEGLAEMWHYHLAANTRITDIVGRMTNCETVQHHACGLVGYYDTTLFDIGMATSSITPLDNDWTYRPNVCQTTLALHGVATEASTIQQMADISGVSATPILDIASNAGNKIFDAKSANWSTVRPQLTGYTTQTLDDITNWYINAGYRVAIPESGSQTKDSWQGYGYFALPGSGAIGIIGGGLKGGGGGVVQLIIDLIKKIIEQGKNGAKGGKGGATAGGPVEVWSGNEQTGTTDLTIGSQENPYSLSFQRLYNSRNRIVDGPLGLGWTHGFAMTAKINSDGMLGLGEFLPISGAAAIVELFVCTDILSDLTRPHDKFMACSLANQWFVDQVFQNTVIVNLPEGTVVFTKLPDGSYVAPPGSPATLVKNGDGTYTVKNPQQVALNFDSSGNIASMVYPNGVTVSFTYTSGKLTSVTNGLTRTLTLSYTGDYLTTVTDGTGRSVTYSVNGTTKNLDSVTDADSKTTSYVYDIPGRLEKVKAPANPTIAVYTNTYDTLGRVKEQRDAFNNLTQFFIAGARCEVVDANNNKQIYYYNKLGSITRFINEVGKETKYEYDGLNRRVKTTFAEGNRLDLTYDIKHNVLTETKVAKSGSGLANIVNQYTYHSTFNKVLTHIDGRSNQTTYTYDGTTGNLLTIQRPQVGSPPQTPTVTLTWNTRGQLLTRTDETGIVTQYNYDTTTEKLTSVVHDFGSGRLNLTTSYTYTSRGDVDTLTDPRGKVWTFQYDVKRRQTQKTDPSPLSYVTKYSWDANDNRWKVERQTDDVLNPWQTYTATFDYMDQLKTVTDPSNHVTSWDYDNMLRLWKVTDAESRVTEYAYDAASRLYTVKDPNLVISETRLYSDNGKLASVKDARNNTTTYSRDGHDRLDRTTYADSSYEQNQSYDANDNVLTYRTRSGNTIVNTWDSLNRRATKAPSGQGTVTYTFDLAGRMTKAAKPVVSGDPSTGDFQFFFDTAGRFFKEQYPDGKIVTHVLDSNANITKTTYPDGYFVDRSYDELNRLTDIKLNGSGTAAAHFVWDPLSRRKQLTFQNGVVTNYTYELDDDLATLAHTFTGSSVTFTLGYNNIHEMNSQQVSDGANYMWHPAAAGTTAFGTADSVNKYPTVGGVSYSYNGNGCLTGDGTWTWTFDTENHMTAASKTGTSITNYWDPVHRQREHKVGSTRNRYIYAGWQRIADYNNTTLQNRYVYGTDMDEVLIKVASGGTLTYYSHNHQGSVVALSNSSGTVTNRYKYNPWGESPSMTGTTHGFQGQRFESESGLYFMKNRYFYPKLGRLLQPDPIGYDAGDLNLYTFVNNDPLQFTDPLGLVAAKPGGGKSTPPGFHANDGDKGKGGDGDKGGDKGGDDKGEVEKGKRGNPRGKGGGGKGGGGGGEGGGGGKGGGGEGGGGGKGGGGEGGGGGKGGGGEGGGPHGPPSPPPGPDDLPAKPGTGPTKGEPGSGKPGDPLGPSPGGTYGKEPGATREGGGWESFIQELNNLFYGKK